MTFLNCEVWEEDLLFATSDLASEDGACGGGETDLAGDPRPPDLVGSSDDEDSTDDDRAANDSAAVSLLPSRKEEEPSALLPW